MPPDNARKLGEVSSEAEYIEYVSSLERQLSETPICLRTGRTAREAAERRCKEYDSDTDHHYNYYTYYRAGKTADHHGAEDAHDDFAVQEMKNEFA